jgi:hypothetical protein
MISAVGDCGQEQAVHIDIATKNIFRIRNAVFGFYCKRFIPCLQAALRFAPCSNYIQMMDAPACYLKVAVARRSRLPLITWHFKQRKRLEIQSGNFNFFKQHAATALWSSLHYRYQKTARHLGRLPDMDWRVSYPSISHLLASLLATAPLVYIRIC